MSWNYELLIYLGFLALLVGQFVYLNRKIKNQSLVQDGELRVMSKGAYFWLVIFLFIAFSPIIIDGVGSIINMANGTQQQNISNDAVELARLLDNYKGVMYTIISVFILFGMSNAIINWSGLSKLREVEANLKLTETKLKTAVKHLAEAEKLKLEIQDAKTEAHLVLTDVNKILQTISEAKVGLDLASKEAREAVGNIKSTADDEREFNNAYFDFNNAIEKKQLEESTESLKSLVKFVEDNPDDVKWQGSLADCYLKLGDLKMSRGNPFEAESCYNSCLQIRQKLVKEDPSNAELQSELAQIYSVLAGIGKVVNNLDGAKKYHKMSIQIMQELTEKNSMDNSWMFYLGVYCNKYGNFEIIRGSVESGKEYLTRASEIFDKLAKIDPFDIKWQKHNVVCYKNLADAFLRNGDYTSGGMCIEKALAGAKLLLSKAPNSISRLRIIAFCYNVAGELKRVEGDIENATTLYEAALATFDKLISKGLIDLDDQHEIVMLNYNLYTINSSSNKKKALEYAQIAKDWLEVLIVDKGFFFDSEDASKLQELQEYIERKKR